MRQTYVPTILSLAVLLAACGEPTTQPSNDVHVDPAIERELDAGESVRAVVDVDDAARWPSGVVVERDFSHVGHRVVTFESRAQLDALVASGSVEAVFEDITVRTTGIADGLSLIGQPEAVSRGFTGAGRSVAVLDTGVDWSRAAFGTCTAPGSSGCRVLEAKDFAPDDGVADSSPYHGTNVAGIVAQTAPDSPIVALDVFDGMRASSSNIIAAVDWVIANRDTYDIAAINMSLGTDSTYASDCDQSVFAAPIESALQNGIVTVVSSGNDAMADEVASPGCVTDAVTVGAIHATSLAEMRTRVCDQYDAAPGDVACFSNASPLVDLLAPGVRVDAAGVAMSGTSQAAPHVAAAVAIVAGAMSDDAGPADWTAQLTSSAVSTDDDRTGEQFARVDLDAATDFPEPPSEEPPAEEPPAEEPPAEEPPAEEPPAEEPPAEEPPAEEPPAEDPVPDDPEPPTAEGIGVTINGGSDWTESRTVTLELRDEQATRFCISNETSCTDWRDFAETVDWRVEPGEGSKTVRVWFARAGAGFLGAERASDTIYLVE